MDEYRRAFQTFLAVHAQKASATDEPAVHLCWATPQHATPLPDAPLLRLDRDDVLEALDPNSELVRWLLEQMRTYDCRTQRIVGLAWDRRTVLSDVLRMPSEWRGGG